MEGEAEALFLLGFFLLTLAFLLGGWLLGSLVRKDKDVGDDHDTKGIQESTGR